jgi:hypothetical protein
VIKTARPTIGTERVELTSTDDDMAAGSSIEAYVISGSTLFVGGPDVTAANGRPIKVDGSYALDLRSSAERLYGVCDTGGSAVVSVLRSGV